MTKAQKQIDGLMCPRQVRLPSLHVLVNFLVMQRPWARLYVSYRLGASQVALVVKNLPANADRYWRHGFDSCVGKIPWSRN